jgi:hypothetical protein
MFNVYNFFTRGGLRRSRLNPGMILSFTLPHRTYYIVGMFA